MAQLVIPLTHSLAALRAPTDTVSSVADLRERTAVLLAAGAGSRLRPLTDLLPKPLCPVGNVALVDHALARLRPHADAVAVNLHHHPAQMLAHLEGRNVHVSHEAERPLGTAGALGYLRDWIDHHPTLVVNADTFVSDTDHDSLELLCRGWSGETVRLLVTDTGAPADFGQLRYAGAALMPWSEVSRLTPVPSGLYERSWAQAEREGRLELIETSAAVIDCGTPRDYLEANLLASGGESVIAPSARVEGEISQCVIWPGAHVRAGEHLRRVIRTTSHTVEAVFREKLSG